MQSVTIELDADLYPLDAVYQAAYTLLDRAWIFLEPTPSGVLARVRSKREGVSDAAAAGQLGNEALTQAYRLSLARDRRRVIEALATRAVAGAAGPPGLDELLEMEIGEATAFDDPLGIAMSWEEKYGKKEKKGEDGG
ncbi:MAG: hypothetical protein HOV80_08110 [Polyangiaceae bacterium]|nr:hypothetical protein [Polyangiaceae bacterium]